jgi:hypothetical protein
MILASAPVEGELSASRFGRFTATQTALDAHRLECLVCLRKRSWRRREEDYLALVRL